MRQPRTACGERARLDDDDDARERERLQREREREREIRVYTRQFYFFFFETRPRIKSNELPSGKSSRVSSPPPGRLAAAMRAPVV